MTKAFNQSLRGVKAFLGYKGIYAELITRENVTTFKDHPNWVFEPDDIPESIERTHSLLLFEQPVITMWDIAYKLLSVSCREVEPWPRWEAMLAHSKTGRVVIVPMEALGFEFSIEDLK